MMFLKLTRQSVPSASLRSYFRCFYLPSVYFLISFLPCTHLLFLSHHPFFFLDLGLLLLLVSPQSKFLRLPLIWVKKKKFHMWGPFEIRQHLCNYNIWVYVAPMVFHCNGFAMKLVSSMMFAQLLPYWGILQPDLCYFFLLSCMCFSQWWLGWKILNNKKGKFNPCSVDLWEVLSFVSSPTHPFFRSWRDPQLSACFTDHIGLKPLKALWLSPRGVSEFRNLTGFQLLLSMVQGYWLVDPS